MRTVSVVAALLMLLMIQRASAESFKAELIPDKSLDGISGMTGVAHSHRSMFTKEPDYPAKARYGTFYGGARYQFAAYASTGKGKADTIILDLDKDRDLTDETPLTLGKVVTVALGSGKGTKVKPVLMPQDADVVYCQLKPAEWHRGKLKLGDKTYEVALVDSGFDGFDLKSNDMLLVDIDGNGEILVDEAGAKDTSFALGKQLYLGGDDWDVTLKTDGKLSLSLSRYEGVAGHLEIEAASAEPGDAFTAMVYLMPEGGGTSQVQMLLDSKTARHRLPAVTFSRSFLVVAIEKAGKVIGALQYSGVIPLTIPRDKTWYLKLDQPKRIAITVSRGRNSLGIGKNVEIFGGWNLSSVMVPKAAGGELEQAPAPKVEIRDETGETVLGQGTMEYG